MNLIIADNQDITALGLEALVGELGAERTVRVSDKSQLLSALLECPASVVVIDYTLFDFTDADALLVVSQRFPNVHWLLFSEQLNDQFIRRTVFNNQQFGIVMKSAMLIEIRHAVENLLAGQRFVCQQVMEMLLLPAPAHNPEPCVADVLTPTEREILRLLALGRTTKEIAKERFSSTNTIITHRKNIFRKLNVNNVHEATRYAFRAGIVDAAEYFI